VSAAGLTSNYDCDVPESVVLLHGFGGTRRTWDGVIECLPGTRYIPRALDLPGHGERAHVRPITFAACAQEVLARAPQRFILGGYSLGGRVALHVALAAPERIERLVLVACSPGIEDAAERAERRRADGRLADELERGRFEEFIERWRRQPLFASEPAHVGRLARAEHRRNAPQALAAVLRGVGAGEMAPLWDALPGLELPATVVVGERDDKFRALGARMAAALPRGQLALVPGGHHLALENPAAVARALEGLDAQPGR
jgi:2-succinyl-6-hydroxy-2,4-cyclohexadiene-1-carboxylate synthase